MSLIQALFLRLPRIRQALNIPAMSSAKQQIEPITFKSIKQGKRMWIDNNVVQFITTKLNLMILAAHGL